MRHLSTAAQAWISLVLLGGCVALIAGVTRYSEPQTVAELASPVFWVLLVAASAAHAFPSIAPRHQAYHASQSFLIAALLLLSWPAVALIILAAHAAEWARRPRPVYIQLYNIAVYLLSGAAALGAFEVLGGEPFGFGEPRLILIAAAGAAVWLVVNHGLIAVVLRLARGVSMLDSGLFGRDSLGVDGTLLLVGIALAGAWLVQPVALIVAAAPLALVYRSLQMATVDLASHRDQLTGLYNARHFVEALDVELRRARQLEQPTGVIVAVLDDVPEMVQRFGRATLDFLLVAIAERISHVVRDYDLLARLDEGKFALLVPGFDLHQVGRIARGVEESVAGSPFALATTREPVAASISVAFTSVASGTAGAADVLAKVRHAANRARYTGPRAVAGVEVASEDDVPTTLTPSPRAAGAVVNMSHAATWSPSWLRLELFEVLVIVPALGVTGIALATTSSLPDLSLAGAIIALVVLSELLAFDLYDRSSFSISFAPILAAGLLGGPPGALLATWSVALARGVLRRSRWDKVLFNGSTFSLAAVIALFVASAGGHLVVRTSNLAALFVTTGVASAVYYLHTFLIAGVLALDLRANPRRVWERNFRWLFPHYLVLGSMGLGLAVASVELGPLGTALFLAPPLAMRFVLKQYTERTSTAVHRLEAKNTELSEASVLLQRRSEELSLLSDLGQLVASEPRSDSLPALVVRRCVPALGDAVAVVWYGAQAVDPAVFWSPSAKSVLPSIGACRVDDFLTLAERVNAGQSVPDWADRTDGQWSAEPLRGADRQLGWLVTWQSGILADSELARLGALTQEVAGRLALALERDTLLEEAASLDALRAVDRAKSDFIATTAHELRTPLTSLQGYAELLRTEVEPSLRDRWLRILDVEAAQLGQVLDQLLDVSRLDSGRFQAQRRVFDLGDVARRAFDGFVEQAASRGHQLQLELNSSPRVYADPSHVERVLRNLISNSLKYTPEGGLIRVGVAERGTAEIEVCVQDPGLGIPPEWLARLFERFQRVDLPERASIRGTGLGLYIARQLVELNDGRIWAESDGLGKGSTFRFTLPIAPPRVRSDAKAT